MKQADKVMQLHMPDHKFYELALYCKGASLFNLGADGDVDSYKKSEPVLQRFVKEYPNSNYHKMAMYLLAEDYTNHC